MSKIDLPTITGGFNLSQINNNFDKIEQALNDKVLYRDNPVGEPNQMKSDLDMNGKRIYNLPVPTSDQEAVRLKDLKDKVVGGDYQKVLRVSDVDIPAYPNKIERANKLASFDSNGNPIVQLPSSDSATQLRIDLANATDPDNGAGMVGVRGGITQADKNREIYSVVNNGALGNGVDDDIAAVLAAKTESNNIHFPLLDSAATTYFLGAFAAGQLDGATISADAGVTLSLAANSPYSLYKNIVFATDVRVFFRDVLDHYVFPKTPLITRQASVPVIATAEERVRSALDGTSATQVYAEGVNWPAGDTFTAEGATREADAVTLMSAGGSRFRGAFVDLGPYETVSAHFDDGVAPGPIGVVIQGTLGYSVIYSNGIGDYFTAFKPIGGAVVGNIADLPWTQLGQGVYTSYAPENSEWSITRVDQRRVVVKLNGKALTALYARDCGDITRVGFVCFNSAPFTVSGLTVERRTDAVAGMQMLDEIRIFGDSTAETFPGSWDGYIKPMLDCVYGLKVKKITNFAVTGETLDQQYASMTTNGLGSSYYVCFCAGTNNIQGLQSLASFKTVVTNIINYINNQGRKAVIIIPWMWYTRAQSGGIGQDSTNYEKGAPYRMAMERIAYSLGAIVVKTTEELPNPDPAYLSTDEPLLRDNIHQDALAYQLYARAITQAIASDCLALPNAVEHGLLAANFLNGASDFDVRWTVDKGGMATFSGTMAVTNIANGTQEIYLPRYLRPLRDTNFSAVALSTGGASILGSCYLSYAAATGTLNISNAPATTAILIISGAYKTNWS